MSSISTVDTKWTQQQIGVVSQGAIMTAHTMGPAGPGSKRRPQDLTREEVIEACRTALHRFVEDLPDGYNTRLGNGGVNLSSNGWPLPPRSCAILLSCRALMRVMVTMHAR